METFAGLFVRSATATIVLVIAATFVRQLLAHLLKRDVPLRLGVVFVLAIYTMATWAAFRFKLAISDLLLIPSLVLGAGIALAFAAQLVWKQSPFRIGEVTRRFAPPSPLLFVLLLISGGYATLVPDSRFAIFSLGNQDVWHYAKLARIALDYPVGDNVVFYDNLSTPTAYVFLAGLAFFTGSQIFDVLPVAMVLVLASSFLLVKETCELHFRIPHWFASLMAAVWTVSACSAYLVGQYFLAQEMAIAIYLAILLVALSTRQPIHFRFIELGLLHYLLLMTYPGLFLPYTALGMFVVVASFLLNLLLGREREPLRSVVLCLLAPFAALLIYAALDPLHLIRTAHFVSHFIGLPVGWPLQLLNPLALVGLGVFPLDDGEFLGKLLGLGLVAGITSAAAIIVFWTTRPAVRATMSGRTDPAGAPIILVLAYLGVLAGYLAYFALLGPSYTQWKFATSVVFPLAFVPWAIAWRAVMAVLPRSWPVMAMSGLAAVLFVLNVGTIDRLAELSLASMRPYVPLRGLEELDKRPGIDVVSILLQDRQAAKITGQFINSKPLRGMDKTLAPTGQLIEDALPANAAIATVTDSCYLLDPQYVTWLGPTYCVATSLDVRDSYEATFMQGQGTRIPTTGLSGPEAAGTWSAERQVRLSIPVGGSWPGAAVTLRGVPFIVPGCVGSQRLVFSVDRKPLREISLAIEAAIDLVLPRGVGDKMIDLVIDLPDAISPKSCGVNDDERLIAFSFKTISVNRQGGLPPR